jgi:hypothetical protein
LKVVDLQSQWPKGMDANIDSVLHPELLGKILQRLTIRDLKMAVLVSRKWREEGEAPGLWAALIRRIRFHPGNINSGLEVLRKRRFQYMRELTVTSRDPVHQVPVSKELLEAAGQLLKLVKITFECVKDFSAVEPALLTGLANRLEEFKLFDCGLTKEQVEAILQGILPGSSRLRILHLHCSELFAVGPALLARATNKIEDVTLNSGGEGPRQGGRMLTKEQLEAILQGILPGSSRLRILDLHYSDLFAVEPALLAGAVTQLEEAWLGSLTRLQGEQILRRIIGGSKLRVLYIRRGGEVVLDRDLLERAREVCEVNLDCDV